MLTNSIGDKIELFLNLQKETSLSDLVEPQKIARGFISTMISPFFTDKTLVERLKATIRQWWEEMDASLEEARHSASKLALLKKTIKPLNGKTALLEEKISDAGIKNEGLLREVVRLKTVIKRITTTQEQAPSPITLPWMQMGGTFIPRVFTEHDPALHNRMILLHQENQHKREIQCTIKKLCNHTHENGEGWIEALVEDFKNLDDPIAIKSLGETIGALQVLGILHHLINNRAHEHKLPLLIGGLPFDKFGEVCLSLENGELISLNRVFKSSEEEVKNWLEEKITEHRDPFVNTCNHLKERIDTLCHDFRKDTRGAYITEGDINYIHLLSDEVELRSEQIIKLSLLYEEIITHPETHHLLGEGLKKEYLTLRTRLSSKKEYADRPAGCVWGILYRNVFERCDLEDEDDAIEIFGDWAICEADDYRITGLLGKLDNKNFDDLKKKNEIFPLGKKNLEKLQIKTIADWKSKNIFNRKMLSNYLKREEVKKLL